MGRLSPIMGAPVCGLGVQTALTEGSQIGMPHFLPDCRCNVTSCHMFLLSYLSYHDGWHPQTASQNKPSWSSQYPTQAMILVFLLQKR